MLVLTRKVGDIIAIGDNIKVVVMAIKGKQVRLGIEADKSTIIHREEIYQKIKQETNAAMQTTTSSSQAAKDLLKGQTESKPDHPVENNSNSKKTIIIRRAKPENKE